MNSLVFLFIWMLVTFVFIIISYSLLLSLICLEVIAFLSIFCFSLFSQSCVCSDYLLLLLFSIFVIEGVIGLTGFIILVSFSGSDYLSTSSLLNL